MRLLLTRPRPDSEALAARLADKGIETLIAPVLQIEPLSAEPPEIADGETVLLTSANGARALARASERRDCRVLAVGDATAAAAREAGFSDVTSAARDSDALTRLAIDSAGAEKGSVLHITGSHVAGDMEGSLTAAGLSYRRLALYEARAAERLPAAVEEALSARGLDGAILYSPRSAAVLGELLAKTGLGDARQDMVAYCLSAAVAKAAGDGWRRVAVADSPDTDALLAMLETPKADKTAPAAPVKRYGGWALAGVLVLAVAYAGARFSETPLPVEPPPPVAAPAPAPALPPVVADTNGPRLDAMESRIAMLETLLARRPEAATPDALEALATRFAMENDALRDESGALAAELGALSERLAKLEARLAQTDQGAYRNGALLLAVGLVRAAMSTGASYRGAFDALAALAEDDDDIAEMLPPLEAGADDGLVGEADLRARFPALAQGVLLGLEAPEDPDWIDETLAEVESLVSVRRVGEVAGDEAEAVLARAEMRLAAGKLGETAALVESLGESEASDRWLEDARVTLAARAALDAVNAAILARAGGAG